jgi:glycerol-3-phosphate dehydrogenase (NAD(P)+)
MKVAVVGAGKWGQAIHYAISQKNENSFISSRTKRDIKNFITSDEVLEFEYLIFAISAQNAREWLENNFVFKNQKILVASKGIEISTGKFLNEVFSEFVPEENLAFISGPSFAAEVMKSLPTAIVINSKNKKLSGEFAELFPSFIKTYTSKDVIGAEVCGAYKNIIAIASGICDGLELGNNARASLISRGLVEMMRFGKHFGAKKSTFVGLSGSGDLFLTASSVLSRNYRVGLGLAKGKKLEDILDELGEVAEGVYTTEAVDRLREQHDIYLPIAVEVFQMIKGKRPQDSLKDLLD